MSYADSNKNGVIDPSTEIVEENNYYPFGLKHEGYNSLAGNPKYQYKYNGKELQETGMYDYGARFYMPDIGRWGVVDPLAEKYSNLSSYNYCANNPIIFVDTDGRRIIFVPGLGYEKGNKNNGPYAENISNALSIYTARYGTSSQTVDGSHGLFGDMLHVMWNSQKSASSNSIVEGTRIFDVAEGIAQNILNNPLGDGEQMNVMGFSQGSVTTAQAVIDIFRDPSKYGLDDNFKIDNLILGGSPISKDSSLYKEILKLQEAGKIGSVIYDEAQLKGDKVTGLGSKSKAGAFWKGLGFIGRMISKKGQEKNVHYQAAQDKNQSTTNFVIDFLEQENIH
ncbi:hypothetical protein GCM10010992_26010 [Cloacibacterium rupense]|uniref:RHS repeat-associated core domain-containing protein n=1 Tax=Cloacibacterium rupense TaxID=517423 RepID=A0ABQ2NM70_9FLAO|nr:hypothetical protein GCM10010992_26010 [Cloacibacterium rupense]